MQSLKLFTDFTTENNYFLALVKESWKSRHECLKFIAKRSMPMHHAEILTVVKMLNLDKKTPNT